MGRTALPLSRRHFLQRSLAAVGLGVAVGCGVLPPAPQQQARARRLGLFHVGTDHVPASLDPLREELARLGYRDGEDVSLDWRNLPDEDAAFTTAREWVRDRVDLIAAFENQTMRAVKEATTEIPVVFLHVDDPVANGWIASLARPGGNLTGFVGAPDLPEKRIEFFKELIPQLETLLVLADPADPVTRRVLSAARRAAVVLGIGLLEREVSDRASIERALATVGPPEAGGIFVASRNLQTNFILPIIRLGLERRLPTAAHRKEFVAEGALFSYGPDQATTGRAAARLIDKILKGAKPADLPVEEMDVLELVVNLRTAQTLGLTIPPSVLQQATEVIQ